MRVLYLGPHSPLFDFLKAQGEFVWRTEMPVSSFGGADFVVSYNYRHILKNVEELRRMDRRVINLHVSLLPWNRGADPNLWSFVEGTPKGVSIHCIDSGIDTGDLLCQRIVQMSDDETLRSSYARLHEEIQALFREEWLCLRDGFCLRTKQRGQGSFHRAADKERIAHLLADGWDTPVRRLMQFSH